MRSIRIPFLIDLKRVESVPDIRAMALDQRIDRDSRFARAAG